MNNKRLLVPSLLALAVAAPLVAAQGRLLSSGSETLTDGQILDVIGTLNEAEIELANVGLKRSDDVAVRQVSEAIIDDHRSSDEQIDLLEDTYPELDTDDSRLSEELEDMGEEVVESLSDVDDAQFACVYLQKQEEQHQLALDLVSKQLLPAAKSEHVTSFLTMSAPKLEHHLQMVQLARANLSGC